MKRILNFKIMTISTIMLLFLGGCKNGDSTKSMVKNELVQIGATAKIKNQPNNQNWEFKYDLSQPEKCVLSKELLEISALTLDNKSNILYAVNDEKAFIYALEDCEISLKLDFGKKGDYEGIEMVNNDLFVLKSSGNIIQYDLTSEDVKREIKTPLKTKNDTEGLGYDKDTNSLLIACKGSASIDKHSKHKKLKAVYSYDLGSDTFIDKPLFEIDDDRIESYLKNQDNSQYSKKEKKKRVNRALDFSPSAIAKNPVDNSYYLLSTVGKTLVVINPEFEVLSIQFLEHPSFIQPEGICFDSSGNMFISNEGKGLVANILKYSRQ